MGPAHRTHLVGSVVTALDQTIAWAGRNGMHVIIDFHSRASIAGNDVVACYELFNEPANPASPADKSHVDDA